MLWSMQMCSPVFTCDSCTGRYCWEHILAMAILSVCPSVTTRRYTKPGWDRDSGSSPYDSLESLVSYEVIWCHWVKRFPLNESIKEGYPCPFRNHYFTTIGSSSMKTVGDRPRQPAYEIKLMLLRVSWALTQISCMSFPLKTCQLSLRISTCLI